LCGCCTPTSIAATKAAPLPLPPPVASTPLLPLPQAASYCALLGSAGIAAAPAHALLM
jgi:hypothetical protein